MRLKRVMRLKQKRIVRNWYYYLIYLFIVSLVVTGVSFSRFSSVINNTGAQNVNTSGSGSTTPDVEFSTWAMDYEAATFYFDGMAPGDTKTITVWVKNKSNTGKLSQYNQNVTLEIKTTGNLPLSYTMQQTGGAPVALSHPDPYRYVSASQEFTANVEETKAYTLTISWPGGSNQYIYRNEIDYIELRLTAVQA